MTDTGMRFDLFNELLQTVAAYDDGIVASHTVFIPALEHLHKMADSHTIQRCLNKLARERKQLSAEGLHE